MPRVSALLWWCYFALYALLVVFTLGVSITSGQADSFGSSALTALFLILDVACLVGLYGYIRSAPLFPLSVWRVVLTLVLARFFVGASFLIPNLFPWEATLEQRVALAGLLSLILALPMVFALWRSAFPSFKA